MNILTVSDRVVAKLVSDDSPIPAGSFELILGCGDLPPEYLHRLRIKYDVPLFYILGNHDIRHQVVPNGCENITRRIVAYQGYHFLGFSGSRWYNGNLNQYREKEMQSQINRLWFKLWLHTKLDVVIAHAPPRYIHDHEDRCHKGFHCYRHFMTRYQPRFFVHGHIHTFFEKPSDRISVFDQTEVINSYGYHIFEI